MPRRQHSILRKRPHRIGGPLSTLLDERFLTHAELAAALGVHQQNVSRWVRNETGPYNRRLRQIADFFGVPPEQFIDHGADAEAEQAAA